MLPLTPVREMNRLLDELWNGHNGANGAAPDDAVRVEVRETPEHVIVRAEVPGIAPKDLDIQLVGDVLTIAGEKTPGPKSEGDDGPVYSERRYGAFRRALRIATPIDADKVRAEHENGVVTITLTKAESTRPRRIEVR